MSYTPEEIALINEASAWRHQFFELRAENQVLREQMQELAEMIEQLKRESKRRPCIVLNR